MSKLTVTLPDDLHAQIRQELEEQGITTGQFIEMVVTKYFTKDKKGETDMATRTIAFQVSEELYQRIKDLLPLGLSLLLLFFSTMKKKFPSDMKRITVILAATKASARCYRRYIAYRRNRTGGSIRRRCICCHRAENHH